MRACTRSNSILLLPDSHSFARHAIGRYSCGVPKIGSMRNGAAHSAVKNYARGQAVLATLLIAALLALNFPIEVLAAGARACTLACCAGWPAHAAGSCMTGSCHAAIGNSKARKKFATQSSETFCGLSLRTSVVAKRLAVRRLPPNGVFGNSSRQSELTATLFERPCASDCGAYTPGFGTRKRPRTP